MDPIIKKRNRELFDLAGERIRKNKNKTLDVIYITNKEDSGADRNFFLLSGIDSGSFLYSSVLLFKDGSIQIFVQELEEEEARLTGLSYKVIKPGEETLFNALKGHQSIGVNARGMTLHEAGRLKDRRFSLVNISPELDDLRAVKTKVEIENLRKSSEIAAAVAAHVPTLVKQGMTEKELSALIDYGMARLGSERPSFDTIVAFGENSAIPHAKPGSRKLKKGDLILCDFGATWGKMCSDITRVYVLGNASCDQSSLYNTILAIQKEALDKIKSGINGQPLHQAANESVLDYFRKIKAPGKMGHGLGHSVGYYCHDGKRIGAVDYIIPENFATTIEPAGYLPGFGGVRIEDTILVTRRGAHVLTEKAPKAGLTEIPC